MQSELLKRFNPLLIIQRGKRVFNWRDEGIQYVGFKYYPRRPDFEDPPYEPTKLFRVQRIKPIKHTLGSQKTILKEFGLDGKKNCVAIIKNIPENNARLWRIKDLVDIQPITFPNGFPDDINGTYLKENGELCVKKNVSNERLSLAEQFRNETKRLDGVTLRRESRTRWDSGWD